MRKLDGKYKREEIIRALIKMKLEECASQYTMLNFLKDNFDYKQSYAYELLREADAKIAEIYKEYNKNSIELAIASLEEQFEVARKHKDRKLMLEITKEINKIKGIYAAQKVEHSGAVQINTIKLIETVKDKKEDNNNNE